MAKPRVSRREAMKLALAAGAGAAASACTPASPPRTRGKGEAVSATTSSASEDVRGQDAVISRAALDFQWPTPNPFLFCVHHDDHYPQGNDAQGPAVSLAGRELGMDFTVKDGFRMYHGEVVPGFPQHPHRGFETITIVRRGLLDHSDSLGATARYGRGDVQWLTAGAGIQHAEMFPCVERAAPNPVELFQIWLNLPRQDKMADPHFTMLWAHKIPKRVTHDADGRSSELTVIAGRFDDIEPLSPPPSSWASRPEADVAIWTLKLAPFARFVLPAARAGSNRALYFFRGRELFLGGKPVSASQQLMLRPDAEVALRNGPDESELLLLQGRPIAEPVVQYGPFVMNSREEIAQAYRDYQLTGFGGRPWSRHDPVHPREEGRFAKHADGHVERPV